MKRLDTLALVALCGLAAAGCKDLKIHSDRKEIRFGESVTVWLTYKDKKRSLPPSATVIWRSDRDGRIGEGTEVELRGLSAGTHEIKVWGRYKDREVESGSIKVRVKNDEPEPEIVGATTAGVGESVTLTGSATDREDGGVPTSALRWRWSGGSASGASAVIGPLPPGNHRIALSATDLAGAKGTSYAYVEVRNRPPTATITSPGPVATIRAGQGLRLRGGGADPDPLESTSAIPGDRLAWSSSRDGVLGSGSTLSVHTLSGGTHTITLRAADEFGATGVASVQVTVVNLPPVVRIVRPQSNTFVSTADAITFAARVQDPDGFSVPASRIVWRSSLHAQLLGTGPRLRTDALVPGRHRITVTASDRHGASATSQGITILVTNQEPIARIRTASKTIGLGESVTLQGRGRDPEDGLLPSSALRWTVREQGKTTRRFLGTGRSLTVGALPFGTHQVFLVARDRDGAVSQPVSITVTVRNAPPAVEIRSPSTGASLLAGRRVTFSGSAYDPDRKRFLSGVHLTWYATRIGSVRRKLGTGTDVTVSTLRPGVHLILLVATDPDDPSLTARARTRIRIRPRPAIQPAPGSLAAKAKPGESIGVIGSLNKNKP